MRGTGIIGFAGQSNMQGFRSDPSLIPADSKDSEILYSVFNNSTDGNGDQVGNAANEYVTLEPLLRADGGGNGWTTGVTVPAGYSSWGFGPEISLSRAMHRDSRPVAAVKWSLGGQSLEGTFNPSPAGFGYTALKNYMKGFESSLDGLDKSPYWLAFVWCQGEEDSENTGQYENYYFNLSRLIEHVRAIARNPDLPFLIVKTIYPAAAVGLSDVQEAQEKAAKEIKNVFIYDPAGLPTYTDNVHFWEDAQLTIGTELYNLLDNVGLG